RVRAVDPHDRRLAARDDAPVQFAHHGLADRLVAAGQFPHPQDGLVVVDGLEMIPERLPADGDAVFDDLGRLAPGERVPLDRDRLMDGATISAPTRGRSSCPSAILEPEEDEALAR